MTTHTQTESKSTSTPIPAMQPTHSGLLPQQEQEEPDRSLLPSEDLRRSPNSPTPPPINPSVGHGFGTMAIGPTTSPVLQRMTISNKNLIQRQENTAEEKKEEEELVQTKAIAPLSVPSLQRQMNPEEEEKNEEEEAVQTKAIAPLSIPALQRQVNPEEEEEKTIQTKAFPGQGLIGFSQRYGQIVTQAKVRRVPGVPVLQRKLAIGQPGDLYEQEADRVADQVMRMPTPKIQRVCPECEEEVQRQPMAEEEEKEETLQTKPLAETITPLIQRQAEPTEEEKKKNEEETLQTKPASGEASTVSPALQNQITALQGGGQPLPESERHFFEPRFGTDFSQVRVHADGQAAEAARAVNARAFTLGRDVVFGAGEYQPSAFEGRRLLAHELTHVVQQNGQISSPPTNFSTNTPSNLSDRDALAVQSIDTFAEGKPAILQQSSKTIMREALFSSTMEICRRGLKSRVFYVSQGGLVVTANARWEASPEWQGTEPPGCGREFYDMTLNQKGLIFDSEYGSCEFEMGSPFSRTWTNLPEGNYYLTIWTNNTNPNCCLRGDIEVSQQSGLEGESCTKPPMRTIDIVHGALDIAGFIPVLGAIPDGINAGIYVVEGDWANVGLSAVAMVPAWGDGVKFGAIAGRSAIKISEKAAIRLGEEGIAKGLKEVKAASKTVHASEETGKAAKLGEEAAGKLEKEVVGKATTTPHTRGNLRTFSENFHSAKEVAEQERIMELARRDPVQAGREYENLIRKELGNPPYGELIETSSGNRTYRIPDYPAPGEITIQGRWVSFGKDKIAQIRTYLEAANTKSLILTVPRLSPEARRTLVELSNEFPEKLIVVRETWTKYATSPSL